MALYRKGTDIGVGLVFLFVSRSGVFPDQLLREDMREGMCCKAFWGCAWAKYH
jgi:hypothetical protein